MSKTLSAAILVRLIPSVALPKLLQQSCSAGQEWGKNGLTGQLADKCVELRELGHDVFLNVLSQFVMAYS